MSPITTHVLDTSLGRPASGVPITLARLDGDEWITVTERVTNTDGRVADLLEDGDLTKGTWRMSFDTAAYFAVLGVEYFYPWAEVVFSVTEPDQHHHVPLLLSPFGYSTYRGS